MKSKPIKKEIRLVLMAAAIIVVIGACVGVIIFNPVPKQFLILMRQW